MNNRKRVSAKLVCLSDWKLDPNEINQQIEEMNGEEILILSVGRFHPQSPKTIEKIRQCMITNRCGILSLKSAREEEESFVLNAHTPATGPVVAIDAKVLRFNRFNYQYVSFKHAIADLCHRANMDSINIVNFHVPGVKFENVGKDEWAELDKKTYTDTWHSVLETQ